MVRQVFVLAALFLALGVNAHASPENGPTCGFYREYLPIMTKQQEVKRIDLNDPIGYVPTSIDRAPDTQAPPVPTGVTVEDATGGVVINVDFSVDRAHLATDFNSFVLYRAERIDSSNNPLGVIELDRFVGSRQFVRVTEGQHYMFALKARDHAGNFSGYSSWVLGISLRETGVQDRFDKYGGLVALTNDAKLNWLAITDFEDSVGWSFDTGAALANSNVSEGNLALLITPTTSIWTGGTLTKAMDLTAEGRFTDDDFVVIQSEVVAAPAGGPVEARIVFFDTVGVDYYHYTLDYTAGEVGAEVAIQRSAFSQVGSLTWADISGVRLEIRDVDGSPTFSLAFDDFRLVTETSVDKTVTVFGATETFNDTGDKWVSWPDDNFTGRDGGNWHIYKDMPGHEFALGSVRTVSATGRYIITREDREQADATHACAMQIRYADGQAGMIFRVRKAPVLAEAPVINAMFTNNSNEAVGRTHSPTAAGLTYGDDATYGAYIETGAGDELSYASVSLPNSDDELTLHAAIRPGFASTTGSDVVVLHHYIDASNGLQLLYNSTDDTWRVSVEVGGSTVSVDSSAQTFSADTSYITLAVTMDATDIRLYVNGVEDGTGTAAGNYPSTDGTLYISNDNASAQDFTGLIFQALDDAEYTTAAELLEWYQAIFAPSGVRGSKVGSPDQRSYYSLELDTANNWVEMREHRIGFDIADLDSALSKTLNTGQVYNIAVALDNQDTDDDGNADTLVIQAYVSADSGKLLDGDSQVFALALTDAADQPFYSGFVGFRSEAANVRFANFRAGSPQRAEEAERAVRAREAGAVDLPDPFTLFQNLPGLRGFWPMSIQDDSGDAHSLGMNSLELNNISSNAIFNIDALTPGLMTYAEFDGSSAYFNDVDNADLSISGTEAEINADIQGLTIGCWLWMDATPGSDVGAIGKYVTTGNQRSYLIFVNSSAVPIFIVSGSGTSGTSDQVNAGALAAGAWSFLVGRFTPGTEVAVWSNGVKTTNTSSIAASIYDSTADFQIGRFDSNYFDGRASMCFLCAAALPDALIDRLWRHSRKLFGV